jgi:ribosomal protein S18 acetylase RimI-like enzyme
MLEALIKELKRNRVRRIDTSVYKRNRKADRFYKKMGFKDLGEERLALVL